MSICIQRMRLLASARLLASRFSSSSRYDATLGASVPHYQHSSGAWKIVRRCTTTGAFHSLDKHAIEDSNAALEIARRLTRKEQLLLRDALDELASRSNDESIPMTIAQTRALFFVNTLPFIGFGFLDNMIMIVAGQYIDQKIGTLLCLSTMTAAAFGNLISDVAGIGLAHYVESIFSKLGVEHPVLTAEQLSSSRARWTTNGARAFGLSIGCIIGMFPLLFYDSDYNESTEKELKKSSDPLERHTILSLESK